MIEGAVDYWNGLKDLSRQMVYLRHFLVLSATGGIKKLRLSLRFQQARGPFERIQPASHDCL